MVRHRRPLVRAHHARASAVLQRENRGILRLPGVTHHHDARGRAADCGLIPVYPEVASRRRIGCERGNTRRHEQLWERAAAATVARCPWAIWCRYTYGSMPSHSSPLQPIPHLQMRLPTRSPPAGIPRDTVAPSCQAGAQAQRLGPCNSRCAQGCLDYSAARCHKPVEALPL